MQCMQINMRDSIATAIKKYFKRKKSTYSSPFVIRLYSACAMCICDSNNTIGINQFSGGTSVQWIEFYLEVCIKNNRQKSYSIHSHIASAPIFEFCATRFIRMFGELMPNDLEK